MEQFHVLLTYFCQILNEVPLTLLYNNDALFMSGLFHIFFSAIPFDLIRQIFTADSMICTICIAYILGSTFFCFHHKFFHGRNIILVLLSHKFKYCFNWFWFRGRHCFSIGQMLLANNVISIVYICFLFFTRCYSNIVF